MHWHPYSKDFKTGIMNTGPRDYKKQFIGTLGIVSSKDSKKGMIGGLGNPQAATRERDPT